MFSIILFGPLIGALLAGFGGRALGARGAMYLTTGILFLACLLSWIAFLTLDHDVVRQITVARWIDSGALSVDWAIRVDTLTAVMLVVVTSVSALVHLYSIGYMEEDPGKTRFFAYLSFFTFAMLMLVTADNLAQLFFGWEGVGLASYLLIGFWYQKESANNAAMKAFIVNRVGDFGYALGIFGLFYLVDSIQFNDIFAAAPELATQSFAFLGMEVNAAETIAILLFVGA
ncbi:MAG: NADH-quinone oxidoreductase subunit L, partial [Alphaproteobacteria bacterium]|nr:NADH-quinone oxidoreductase subunit L [Alphaproteobacteria bacterium]